MGYQTKKAQKQDWDGTLATKLNTTSTQLYIRMAGVKTKHTEAVLVYVFMCVVMFNFAAN